MSTFFAQFPGRCAAECGNRIKVGDLVLFVDGELVHAGCILPRERPICPKCHMMLPCWCD